MSVTVEELDNLEVGDKVYIRMYSEVKDLITTERDLYKCFYGKPLTVMERDTDDRIAVFDETDHTGIVFPVAVVDTIVKRVKEPSKVHHPNHYNQNGMEVWDVIKAFTLNLSGAEAFYAGNAIKYILRWDKKNGIAFGAGVVCTGIMFAYGAVANHEDPSLPGEEVLILNGNDNRQYKVVAISGVKDGCLSLATINRIK